MLWNFVETSHILCSFNQKIPEKVKGVLDAIRTAGHQLVSEGKVATSTLESVAMDICSTEELVVTANTYWDRELGIKSE